MPGTTSCKDEMGGKVCLITGASRALGAEIARRMAHYGLQVAVNYHRSQDVALTLCDELATLGGKALSIQADVSQPEHVERLVTETVEQLGPIDILVNNVGPYVDTPFLELSVADFDRILAGNLRATFLLSQIVGRRMREQGHGHIINIAATDIFGVVTPFKKFCTLRSYILLPCSVGSTRPQQPLSVHFFLFGVTTPTWRHAPKLERALRLAGWISSLRRCRVAVQAGDSVAVGRPGDGDLRVFQHLLMALAGHHRVMKVTAVLSEVPLCSWHSAGLYTLSSAICKRGKREPARQAPRVFAWVRWWMQP